ncbi:hypothetical protein O3I_002180 [Nocardia brasiliensis ATCC 700358]|uniref:Uncharacterized protein n=1 Tax=Nocardia brasiliensis (strain ATCC 700358 / HUJEG-1) TaxID=1133849 RepID=K0EN37_NOCB7|nr:hypothetical protein O3I_002180 [Nocardia brasiliensis ATCC 700358]
MMVWRTTASANDRHTAAQVAAKINRSLDQHEWPISRNIKLS